MRKTSTTAPVAAGQPAGPEFVRPGDMYSVFGIGRTHSYQLMEEGKIKSVSLREPGSARGIRLISVASVRAFLNGRMNEIPEAR